MIPDHSERLADSLETSANDLIAELQAVRDSVEELYILLDHIWRNREELRWILDGQAEERAEKQGEAVCCVHCDASESSVAAAVKKGWTRLQADDSPGWDFLGFCPDCRKEQDEEERRRQNTAGVAPEMGLTQEQTAQGAEEGVTTALGLRRVEKNTRADEIAETIACTHCDAVSPESLAAALQEGWTGLCRDDGPRWNYLGVCPECQGLENEPSEPDNSQAKQQKRLFG